MTGLSIKDLPWPADEMRIDLLSPKFESTEQSINEDRVRAKRLRSWAKNANKKRRKKAVALANALDPEITVDVPATMASSRYMRGQRIRTIGALLRVVADDATGEIARFDIIKPSWACDSKRFKRETPDRIRAEFRLDILRAAAKVKPGGASACHGFLFAVLHGEFETHSKLYQPHWHLIATGDWVAVLDGLRKMKAYKPDKRVNRPIRASRNLDHMAYALSYLMKSYWPSKWSGQLSGVNRQRRSRGHRRIPNPFDSYTLLWLDQFRLSDVVLLMNIKVCKPGFQLKVVHQ